MIHLFHSFFFMFVGFYFTKSLEGLNLPVPLSRKRLFPASLLVKAPPAWDCWDCWQPLRGEVNLVSFTMPTISKGTNCSKGTEIFLKWSQKGVSPMSFQKERTDESKLCWLSTVCKVLTQCLVGVQRSTGTARLSKSMEAGFWLSPLPLPLSPLHNYTGYQRLLVNYCSTYVVPDLVISPLHILTYLSLTSLG